MHMLALHLLCIHRHKVYVAQPSSLLDATVLPNEYDDDPEAEAAFDAALKRGPRR